MAQLKDYYSELVLTSDQSDAVEMLQSFIHGDSKVFILNGYAVSCKTTMLKGVVEYLKGDQRSLMFLAPTGRAVKVIHDKTNVQVTTKLMIFKVGALLLNYHKFFSKETNYPN